MPRGLAFEGPRLKRNPPPRPGANRAEALGVDRAGRLHDRKAGRWGLTFGADVLLLFA